MTRRPSPVSPPPPGRPPRADAAAAEEPRAFEAFLAAQDPVDAAAAEWLVRRQEGLTAEEARAFEQWRTDPAHAQALRHLESLWHELDRLPEGQLRAWRQTPAEPSTAMPRRARPRAPQRQVRERSWRGPGLPALSMAAAVFVVVGAGWLGWTPWQRQPSFDQHYATARGQQSSVSLPDGTRMWLDTATRLDATLYRDRREVRLPQGQAQFVVQADPQRPFDVLAGPWRITVVGTRFSVRHTPAGAEDAALTVAVEEGRVRVARQEGAAADITSPASIELAAGQSIAAAADGVLGPVSSSTAAEPAWRDGRVSFEGATLGTALAEFERYGDTGLVVRDPIVASMRIQGSFDLRRLDAFRRALPQVLPVRLATPDAAGVQEIVRR